MSLIDEGRVAGSNVQYLRFPFAVFAEAQRRLGISAIELWGSAPHIWCDHLGFDDPRPVMDAMERAGLEVAAFSPRPYTYSLCAPSGTRQRDATLRYYENCVDLAASLGARLLCLAPVGGFLDRPLGEARSACLDALASLCERAARSGVGIAIGAAPRGESAVATSLSELEGMARDLRSPLPRVLLDTSLACAAGETIGRWFDSFGPRIAFVRFSDGRNSGPRIWGEGCLPCRRILGELEAAGYRGTLSLHVAGDRYCADPEGAERRSLAWLGEHAEAGL